MRLVRTRRVAATMFTATCAAIPLGVAGIAGATPIINDPPVAHATAAPNPAHVGEAVTLDGSGSTDEETSAGNLLYAWDPGDGSPSTGQSTANFEVDHAYATAGVYTATLTVTDPQGKSDTDQVVINVDDTAPVAAASATPTTAMVQHDVQFDASGSADAETADDGLAFHWDFRDGGTATGVSATHAFTAAGSYQVLLTVTDPQGVSDSATVTVTVTNSAPTANGTIDPAAPHKGAPVTFDATTSADAETPDALAYDWDFGDSTPHATTAVATHTYTGTGAKTVKLKVTDPQGLTSTKTFDVAVAANAAPTAVAAASRSRANVGQPVTFDGTGSSDPESTDLTYSWNFGDGGSTEDATTAVATGAYAAPGSYTVTLTVTDGNGLTGTDTLTVQVGNEAPTAVLAVTPEPAYALQTLTFDASGSTDAETPDQLTYSWLFGDGTSTPYAASPTATHTYGAAGSYPVTLRVKDAKGALGTQTRTVDVLANSAPVAAATATPDPVHVGGIVTFDSAGTTDADGDPLSYTWDFPFGPAATGATVHHGFAASGTFDVVLTVEDSHGASDTTTLSVTVVNDAPSAAFRTSRGVQYVGLPVSFAGKPSNDTENPDELTYAWSFGDGSTGTGINATRTYVDAGAYPVTLTVTDPQGLSSTATRTVFVSVPVACQDRAVARSAQWRSKRSPSARGGRYCDNLASGGPDGGRMTVSVTGPRVGLTFARSRAGGSARVTIDGTDVGTISFKSRSSTPTFGFRKVFTGLSDGRHTIKVKMVNGTGYVDDFLAYGPVG